MKLKLRLFARLIAGFCASFTAPGPMPERRREALDRAGRASGYQWMRCVD